MPNSFESSAVKVDTGAGEYVSAAVCKSAASRALSAASRAASPELARSNSAARSNLALKAASAFACAICSASLT